MMRNFWLNFTLMLTLWTVLAHAQEPFSIEPTPRDEAASLPPALHGLLAEPGTRLLTPVNGQNTIVAEMWWRKAIPVEKAGPAGDDISYGKLKVGTLLGVLRFLPEASERFREDFRDQKLRPGFYTMRYAQIPADRSHKDAGRYRDALVLSRVSVDTDYAKVLSVEEMLKQSRLASHTAHPAVLSLPPVRTVYKEFPKAVSDNSGLCTLQFKLRVVTNDGQESEMPFAVIIVTPEVEEGGS